MEAGITLRPTAASLAISLIPDSSEAQLFRLGIPTRTQTDMKAPRVPPRRFNPAHRALLFRHRFPWLQVRQWGWRRYVFEGWFHPRPWMERYRVHIVLCGTEAVRVSVREPSVCTDAPHQYEDQTLCLFHPRIRRQLNVLTIDCAVVTWTSYWLYFYEIWEHRGVWLGPEAVH